MQTAGPMPAHSLSKAQARHVLAVALAVAQMGVAPEHWVLLVH
jgi:hypothetical protein